MDAIILSGSDQKTEQKLGVKDKALLLLEGKPMIDYVVEALLAAPSIDRVLIAGSKEIEAYFAGHARVVVVPCGKTAIESLFHVFPYTDIHAERLLLCTNDLPLLDGDIVENFIGLCRPQGLDVYYPLISEAVNLQSYPKTVRTYIKFKEGLYTGGNMFLIRPAMIARCRDKIEKLVAARKSLFQIACIVGLPCLFRYATGSLDLPSAVRIGQKALGIQGAAIICPDPEISIDVDKTSDLALVEETLRKRQAE